MAFVGFANILSNGTLVHLAAVPAGLTTPTPYTLTVAASASAGATSISVTSSATGLSLQHGSPIYLSDGTTSVIAYVNNTTSGDDLTAVGTSATTVPVRPLSGALTTSHTAVAYNLRRLFGVKNASVPMSPESEDTRAMEDGIGVSQGITGVNRQATFSGQTKTGDRAIHEILRPYLTSDTNIRGFLWVDVLFPHGAHASGLVRMTGGNGFLNAQVSQHLTYDMQFTFQGDNGFFYENPTEAALFAGIT
jgi:hypothetical protein